MGALPIFATSASLGAASDSTMIVYFSPSGGLRDGEVQPEPSARLVMSNRSFLMFAERVAARALHIQQQADHAKANDQAQRVVQAVGERRRLDDQEDPAPGPSPLH
jgi:hypothetical protein